MSKNESVAIKTMALGYGVSVKTLSNRIKNILPGKKGVRIRLLFPNEVTEIVKELGPFETINGN